METGWKEVLVTDKEYQAIIARDILENNGIHSVVINRRDSIYPSHGLISVLVAVDDEEPALNLLKDLKY